MCVIYSMQFWSISCETRVRVETYQFNLWYESIECTSIFLIKFKDHCDIKNTILFFHFLCSNMAPTHKRGVEVCIQIHDWNMWVFIYHHWTYRWFYSMWLFLKISFISWKWLYSLPHCSHILYTIMLAEYSVSMPSVNLTVKIILSRMVIWFSLYWIFQIHWDYSYWYFTFLPNNISCIFPSSLFG